MGEGLERLVHRLDLQLASRNDAVQVWAGEAGKRAMNMSNRLFGGMVLAQTVMAAGRSMPERSVHSVQQCFLRGGRAELPLEYRTELLFEGRTFATLRVEVHQDGAIISHAQVGLTKGIDGPDRQIVPPARTDRASSANRDEMRNRPNWQDQPVEIRIDPDTYDDGEPTNELWWRPAGALPEDPLVHQAVMAYVTDRAFMGTAWKPLGPEGSYKGATLDHSIWFHRPVHFVEWHRYSTMSPNLNDGRGLVQGSIIDSTGSLIATTTQQGTLRPL